jgi:nicotinic acid phosphoribosyltransferase
MNFELVEIIDYLRKLDFTDDEIRYLLETTLRTNERTK